MSSWRPMVRCSAHEMPMPASRAVMCWCHAVRPSAISVPPRSAQITEYEQASSCCSWCLAASEAPAARLQPPAAETSDGPLPAALHWLPPQDSSGTVTCFTADDGRCAAALSWWPGLQNYWGNMSAGTGLTYDCAPHPVGSVQLVSSRAHSLDCQLPGRLCVRGWQRFAHLTGMAETAVAQMIP